MALMGRGKEELLIELAEAKGELRAMRTHVTFLEEQLRKTQDALVAKESPAAYQDQKEAELAARPVSEGDTVAREKMKQQMAIDKKWLEELEQPLFKDADDMTAMLLGVLNRPSESRSVHENQES
jgi:hypothetical protein